MAYVITEISQAKKNVDRVNLYLNGKFWLGMSKNQLVSLRLLKGQELSEIEKQEIESAASSRKVIEQALNYLARRPRSVAEVRSYLVYRKKVTEEETEHAISYLQENDLLSDERFAQWYFDLKLASGVNGVNKIKTELMQKGVASKIIGLIIEKLTTTEEFKDEQITKIKEFVEKIIGSIKAKDKYELRTKLIQRLLGRGFKYDDVKKVVKEYTE